ncbi:MAG: hypothetical protein QM756_42150 [Polyangiaceae bacterium]
MSFGSRLRITLIVALGVALTVPIGLVLSVMSFSAVGKGEPTSTLVMTGLVALTFVALGLAMIEAFFKCVLTLWFGRSFEALVSAPVAIVALLALVFAWQFAVFIHVRARDGEGLGWELAFVATAACVLLWTRPAWLRRRAPGVFEPSGIGTKVLRALLVAAFAAFALRYGVNGGLLAVAGIAASAVAHSFRAIPPRQAVRADRAPDTHW